MTSQVETLNMGLGHLGQTPTESVDLNGTLSTPARKLLVFMESARSLVLKEHDWLEATMQISLNPVELSGYKGAFTYVYAIPNDFVRVARMECGGAWQRGLHVDGQGIQKNVIYAEAPLTGAAIILKKAWDKMSDEMALLVSLKLAILGCASVTGSVKLRPSLEDQYTDLKGTMAIGEGAEISDNDESFLTDLSDFRRSAL